MNSCLSLQLLDKKKELLAEILTIDNPHHEKKVDAQLKWLGVADAYQSLGLQATTLVDVGCGPSSLPLYFKKYVPTVYGVDFYLDPEPSAFLQKNGIEFVREDVEHSNFFQPGSIDCIVDACAIGCSMDIERALKKVHMWLKPGGYFITVGDSDIHQTYSPFASPSTWVQIAKRYGLELVGDFQETVSDDAYHYAYGRYMLHVSRLVFRKKQI